MPIIVVILKVRIYIKISKSTIMKKMFVKVFSLILLLLVFAQVDAQTLKKSIKAGKTSLKSYKYEAAIQSFTEAIGYDKNCFEAYVLRAQ